ncbi:hypothetical protein BK704_01420 [[Bacillus thuringiensis] serovar konkukian]|nr:hypothetical protein [Bacillus thuringiensis]MED1304784.1 hypothetical protein [Bacillus pacificus]OUA94840.1 hypothetical protein BK704_28995 [[Bacillus thuringiensis] serovar konkukian]OUB17492.1 hypothetical protein BK704_01500 [[Bacillus thuringiensis] serovar konkukian]OUB17559.1 hypothetical protein BK704_01420 [[Bacillus thuringiensis] serovar konkukian]
MIQKLDKKTIAILEQNNLNLDYFSVELSIRQPGNYDVNDGHLIVEVSFFSDYESEDVIGSAVYFLYDATNVHVSNMRDMADGYSFDMYQALSSVRIYCSKDEAILDEIEGYIDDPEENTPWIEIQNYARETGIHAFSYEKGFEQGTFEGLPYDEKTFSVWGEILVLNDIKIQEEYRTNVIISTIFRNMLLAFKNIGLDWLIINPNINEEYMKRENYPFSTPKKYNTFLSKIGFTKTYGRLHNEEFCWCLYLQGIK